MICTAYMFNLKHISVCCDHIPIPPVRILRIPFLCPVSCIILIVVNEAIAFLHFTCSGGYHINRGPGTISEDIHTVLYCFL